ncbi:MAG: phage adaptor protein [Casimicrobium sp.]
MISNLSELSAEIAARAKRTDLALRIPEYIWLAEKRMSVDIESPTLVKTQDVVFTTNSAAKPSDLRLEKMLFCAQALDPVVAVVSEQELARHSAAQVQSLDRLVVAIVGRTYQLAYTPPSSITMRVTYQANVPNLTLAAPTNEILTQYPFLYLYACLIELFNDTLDAEEENRAEAKYRAFLSQVNIADQYRGQAAEVSLPSYR